MSLPISVPISASAILLLQFCHPAVAASNNDRAGQAAQTAVSDDDKDSTDGETEVWREAAKTEKTKPPPRTQEERKSREEKLHKLDKDVESRIKQKPQSPQAHHSAARYYMERGDNARAAALADNALSMARPDGDPKLTSRLLVTRGLLRYAKRDYRGAHLDGELALENDPKNWAAFELYMYSLEKWPKGKKPLSAAVAKVAGGLASPSENGADIARRGSGALPRGDAPPVPGNPEEQAADRERVERLIALQTPGVPRSPEEWVARQKANPSPAYELLVQAKNAQASGNLSSALRLAEAAVKADPGDPMVYAQRALILNHMGDSNGAVLDLSKVIAKGWKWALAFRIRADALFKAKKWRAALADAELAARLDPSDPDAWFILGMSRSLLGGDSVRALAELDRAVELKPAMAPFRDAVREKIGGEKESVR